MSTVKTENLITPAQAAKILGITPSAIRARAAAGTLPFVSIAGMRFFDGRTCQALAAMQHREGQTMAIDELAPPDPPEPPAIEPETPPTE